MSKEYVVMKEGAYRVAGSRVSLDSIVYEFLDGRSPETIRDSFPTLSLEQVYGALTFYLAHRDEIGAYLAEGDRKFDELQTRSRQTDSRLNRKLDEARRLTLPS